MDSIKIRATAPYLIEKLSRPMGRAATIEKSLQEYESFGLSLSRPTRGLISELRACCYFASLGYRPLFHRHKISGIEVDWISSRQCEHQIWEVKSVSRLGDFASRGIQPRQLTRLKTATLLWSSLERVPTSLWLMEVDILGHYQILPLDFME
jgi:Holliday junction resolvase-like predicted endonuclease